jgi:hypothetical protein
MPAARYLIAEADDAESCMASVTISPTAGLGIALIYLDRSEA